MGIFALDVLIIYLQVRDLLTILIYFKHKILRKMIKDLELYKKWLIFVVILICTHNLAIKQRLN